MASFTLRDFTTRDTGNCVAIYHDAVLNGTYPHYTPAEAAAWAPWGMDPSEWTGRLATGRTWIAETGAGPQGFITLAPGGHLDLFFVRPAARELGVAAVLYDRLVAETQGEAALTTHASHLARRFLERRGWQVVSKEQALRNGVMLTRFQMRLDRPGT